MGNRATGFVALLIVIGVSIVFGMVLGGRLSAPEVAFAASKRPALELTPAQLHGGMTSFADVVERSLPAVVAVTSTKRGDDGGGESAHPFLDDPFFRQFFGDPDEGEQRQQPRQDRIGEGSGFIISPDGYVLTNNHVVEDYDKIEIGLQDGTTYAAELIGADQSVDLALLKIEPEGETLPTLPLGDSDGLRVGEWVIAIGNPLDFEQTVTVGVVSGKQRRVAVPGTDSGVVSFIQTDAAINLGNSGGPLIDGRGNVIGINTAIRRRNFAEGIGFALPVNTARAVVEQLRTQGYVRRGYIGIEMNQVGIDDAARDYYGLPDKRGVIISNVTEGGPAETAGLRRGDVLRSVDGKAVRDNLDLIAKISSRQPGERVELTVFRDGKDRNINLTLGDRERGLERATGGSPGSRPDPDDKPSESTGLGLTVEQLGAAGRERLGIDEPMRGVVITDVEFGSQAASKGLFPDMVVTGLNDAEIGGLDDWAEAIDGLEAGSPVKLEIYVPGLDQMAYIFLRVPDNGD